MHTDTNAAPTVPDQPVDKAPTIFVYDQSSSRLIELIKWVVKPNDFIKILIRGVATDVLIEAYESALRSVELPFLTAIFLKRHPLRIHAPYASGQRSAVFSGRLL